MLHDNLSTSWANSKLVHSVALFQTSKTSFSPHFQEQEHNTCTQRNNPHFCHTPQTSLSLSLSLSLALQHTNFEALFHGGVEPLVVGSESESHHNYKLLQIPYLLFSLLHSKPRSWPQSFSSVFVFFFARLKAPPSPPRPPPPPPPSPMGFPWLPRRRKRHLRLSPHQTPPCPSHRYRRSRPRRALLFRPPLFPGSIPIVLGNWVLTFLFFVFFGKVDFELQVTTKTIIVVSSTLKVINWSMLVRT